jgi:hypothetical protein
VVNDEAIRRAVARKLGDLPYFFHTWSQNKCSGPAVVNAVDVLSIVQNL